MAVTLIDGSAGERSHFWCDSKKGPDGTRVDTTARILGRYFVEVSLHRGNLHGETLGSWQFVK